MNLLSRFGGRLWDPLREMNQLQREMGRLLNSSRPIAAFEVRESPPVNVYVNENDILVTLEAPGVDPAAVEIVVTGSTLTLTGNRCGDAVGGDAPAFHRRERPRGRFQRTLQLPFEVDASRTEASYARGVLSVKLTRPESSKPRKIAVKAG